MFELASLSYVIARLPLAGSHPSRGATGGGLSGEAHRYSLYRAPSQGPLIIMSMRIEWKLSSYLWRLVNNRVAVAENIS